MYGRLFFFAPFRTLRSLAFLAALPARFLCLSSFQAPLEVLPAFCLYACLSSPHSTRLGCVYKSRHCSANVARTALTCHMTFFVKSTFSRKRYRANPVYQGVKALFTNSFCPITQIKRQLPAHADSCLVCKTRMNSYLRFITSLTFSMMWRPMSLEASTVCAPMWGLMTKLSQEKSGLWNSSLPLRPLPASSFSITSAA